jgi:ferredoxin
LGRLDESLLIGAVCLGAEALWLIDAACQDCPYAVGQAVATQRIQRANALLRACGVAERIFIGPGLPEALNTATRPRRAAETLSRRAFFSVLAHRSTGVAATVATATLGSLFDRIQDAQSEEAKGPKKGELPVRLPLKRQVLLAALKGIGKPGMTGSVADGELWAQFGFEESCTGCQMCAFFCPTGALGKIENEEKAGVTFRVSHCTNCGLCRDICYKEAVVLSSVVDLGDVLDDAVETLWMRGAADAPWLASPEEKLKKLMGVTS